MSLLKNEVDILRRVPLFSGVDAPKLKLLAFTSQVVRYRAQETLFAQGDAGDSAYVILSGKARVFANTDNGPIELAEVGETDFVGEIAILCDVPRTATVVASTNLATLRVGKDAFFNLVTQFPQVGVGIMSELAHRLHQTTLNLTDLSSKLRQLEMEGGRA